LEQEWGTLEGLRLAPVDRGALYLAKLLGNVLFMLAVEAASLPIAGAFFGLPVLRPALLPVLLLGTLGFAAVGTLFAAMAAHTRAREVLLPVLLLPIAVPVVIASVQATAGVLDGRGTGPWLNVLVAFDAIFLVVAFLAFEAVLEE
jgi:heme exporter protein B